MPAATAGEIRELLADYAGRRGIGSPVGLAISNAKSGQLAREITDRRAKRAKTEAAQTIAELRKGPPCDHGTPGGASLHPLTGRPLCALCRAEAGEPDPDIS